MGILYDLANLNLNLNKLKISDMAILNKRGAYPVISHGEIIGFETYDGEVLMYV